MIRSFATMVRRAGDPDRRRAAAGGLLLGSVGLLGGLWVLLPGGEPPMPRVVDEVEAPASSALLSGPSQLVLPLPDEGEVRAETVLRPRRSGVEVVDATVVNNDAMSAELSSGEGGTQLVVTSTAVHQCNRYAGSVVVTSRHPDTPRDHLFVDVRYADCEGVTAVPAAPSSVNDTSRTWGDDGRAPWVRRAPADPDPNPDPPPDPDPPPEPADPTEGAADPGTTEPTGEPTEEPTTEPSSEPTGQPDEPTQDPDPTGDPDPEPSSPGSGEGEDE